MKTFVNIIVDKSGSMQPLVGDTIGGFNQLLAEQRSNPDPCRVSLTLFDTVVAQPYRAQALTDVPDLTPETYRPDGFTALLDAVGHTIRAAEADVAADEQCLTVIITDGQENASHEYSRSAVKALIEEKIAVGWQFVYLGANVDAFAEAGAIGVPAATTVAYAATSAGLRGAYGTTSQTIASYRGTGQATVTPPTIDPKR